MFENTLERCVVWEVWKECRSKGRFNSYFVSVWNSSNCRLKADCRNCFYLATLSIWFQFRNGLKTVVAVGSGNFIEPLWEYGGTLHYFPSKSVSVGTLHIWEQSFNWSHVIDSPVISMISNIERITSRTESAMPGTVQFTNFYHLCTQCTCGIGSFWEKSFRSPSAFHEFTRLLAPSWTSCVRWCGLRDTLDAPSLRSQFQAWSLLHYR